MSRHAITLVLLLCTTTLHLLIGHEQSKSVEASSISILLNIPPQILEFRQARPDTPVSEAIRQNLETNTILMRDYVAPNGRPVQLTIVYAEKTRRSLHFPEVCFTGQGWETHGKSTVPVGISFVGQGLTVQKGDANEAVLYWFKTGQKFTGSYLMNTYHWSCEKLLMEDPSTMLIRLSTPIGEYGEDRAYRALNNFATGLAPILLDTIP